MLIGKITTNSKRRVMVTIEDQKGVKVVDLRSYQVINDGELMPTSEVFPLPLKRLMQLLIFSGKHKEKLRELKHY